MIGSAKLAGAQAVARIYNWYIENTIVSFEDESVPIEEMRSRMKGKMAGYP